MGTQEPEEWRQIASFREARTQRGMNRTND